MYNLTSNLETIINNTSSIGNQWYHEQNRNSDELLITAGDSWTWGDSLDPDKRTDQIYGSVLSKKLNCDWINVGLPGESNLVVKDYVNKVITNLNNDYKNITVVITLTESTRDLVSLEFCKDNYNNIKGESWPEFQDLTWNNISVVESELPQFHLVDVLKMHIAIQDCVTIQSTIGAVEDITVKIINQSFPEVNIIFARNFTSWSNIKNSDVGKLWTEVIAENGKLSAYPESLLFLTSRMGSDLLISYQNRYNKILNFKQDLINHMDKAELAIDWLDASPYNSKIATKHPLETGHQWWAEHLYNYMQQNGTRAQS